MDVNDLISKDRLEAKFIDFQHLLKILEDDSKVILVDIREQRQRKESHITLESLKFRNISFKNMVQNVITVKNLKIERLLLLMQ